MHLRYRGGIEDIIYVILPGRIGLRRVIRRIIGTRRVFRSGRLIRIFRPRRILRIARLTRLLRVASLLGEIALYQDVAIRIASGEQQPRRRKYER